MLVVCHELTNVNFPKTFFFPTTAVTQGYRAPRVRGRVGRPHCLITQEQLEFLLSLHFTLQQIADLVGVSRRTVTQRLR